MGRNNKKKHAKHKQAKPSTSQGGGAIAGQPPRHDDKMQQQGKPAYLASSTEGAPPAPPSLVKAVGDNDETKAKKVLKKLTGGKSKGAGRGGKGDKERRSKGEDSWSKNDPWTEQQRKAANNTAWKEYSERRGGAGYRESGGNLGSGSSQDHLKQRE